MPGSHFLTQQNEQTLDDVYDYTEVRRAVEQILHGDTPPDTVHAMHDYVVQRRLDLFEANFGQTLHTQVEAELEKSKQALEEDHAQDLERVKQETAKEYEEKLHRLQEDYDELDASYQAAIRTVTKQSKEAEQVKQLQDALQRRMQEVEKKRQALDEQKLKLEAEARAKERQLKEESARQLEEELQRQGTIRHEGYAELKAGLEAHYAEKERDLQLQTETTIHQIVADCARLLTETQLAVLNLISPDVCKGVGWLQRPEMMALIAQIHTVRETLEQAEERLLHGDVIFDTERRSYDGSQVHH